MRIEPAILQCSVQASQSAKEQPASRCLTQVFKVITVTRKRSYNQNKGMYIHNKAL